MTFDPKTDKFPYPIDTDKHYLVVKKNKGIIFDEKYPYIDKSKGFRFKKKIINILIYIIMFPLIKIRMGLKIKGRKNLKIHKEIIKQGVISVCNHIHMWDYLSIMCGIRHIKPYILSWAPNINGENGFLIRMVGGIPIPENNFRGTISYLKTVRDLLTKEGGWLHVYSEGSMWEYYGKIRPFKRGAAYFACKYNKPIIPLAYSYRRPSLIRRKIFKQIALLTLNIGEPIFPNDKLTGEEQEIELTKRSHEEVCKLAGIDPKENLYEPLFNDSKRIDYYTKEYGKNYKGSW